MKRSTVGKVFRLEDNFETIGSSLADVGTDWYYYVKLVNYEGKQDLSSFKTPLMILAIVSSIMFIIVMYLSFAKNVKEKEKIMKYVLILEILLADLPQMILTGFAERKKDGNEVISVEGAYTLIPAIYNLLLNVVHHFRINSYSNGGDAEIQTQEIDDNDEDDCSSEPSLDWRHLFENDTPVIPTDDNDNKHNLRSSTCINPTNQNGINPTN